MAGYLARYLKGGPIKKQRIQAVYGDAVTFRVSRRGEPLKLMTLTTAEFIRRILMHVPPPGFKAVRAYGLYAHTHSQQREHCGELLGGQPLPLDDELGEAKPRFDPREQFCTVCGCELVVAVIPRQAPGHRPATSTGGPHE